MSMHSSSTKKSASNLGSKFPRWGLCKGCDSPYSKDSECNTCLALAAGELVSCDCGSRYIAGYRRKGIPRKDCLRCIVAGLYEPRTEVQYVASQEFTLCPGICGLMQRESNLFHCKACFAVADAKPELRKVLSAKKSALQQEKHRAKFQQSWIVSLHASIEASCAAADASSKVTSSVADLDETIGELEFLHSLRSAQRGVSVTPSRQSSALSATSKPRKPAAVVVLAQSKSTVVDTDSLKEFPTLG